MKRHAFYLLALMAAATTAVAGKPTPTPSEITQSIRTHGARQTVRLLDEHKQFDAVLNKIATGKSAWVSVVPALAKGTDAGDSDGLINAMATALPHNARAVLSALDDGPVINAQAVCGVPFIEPTHEETVDYLARAIPAVTGVAPSARLPHRGACLDALHKAKESLATQH